MNRRSESRLTYRRTLSFRGGSVSERATIRRSASRVSVRARSMAPDAADAPGTMKRGRQVDLVVEGVDPPLQPLDHPLGNRREVLNQQVVVLGVDGHLSRRGEHIVLAPQQDVLDPLVGGQRPRHAHGGYGRVDRAVRLGPRPRLRGPPSKQKPRRPVVAALGVKLHGSSDPVVVVG